MHLAIPVPAFMFYFWHERCLMASQVINISSSLFCTDCVARDTALSNWYRSCYGFTEKISYWGWTDSEGEAGSSENPDRFGICCSNRISHASTSESFLSLDLFSGGLHYVFLSVWCRNLVISSHHPLLPHWLDNPILFNTHIMMVKDFVLCP